MITVDDFLNKYKELEAELREADTTVLDFENTLPADDSDRLKICRQIRNYVQHHSDGHTFLSATPAMCKFVENTLDGIRAKKEKVKDRLKRIKAVSETDKLENVCVWMSKNKKDYVPVIDKDSIFLGILTSAALINALTVLSLKRKVREVGRYVKALTASPSEDLEKYQIGDEIIVVDKDKYKGIVKW